MPTKLPNYPWLKIGTDLFSLNGVTYLLASDYLLRYPEVIKLNTVTSDSAIPEEVVNDNGPLYASQEFKEFAKESNFKHTSPHFPQSNVHAEQQYKLQETLQRL